MAEPATYSCVGGCWCAVRAWDGEDAGRDEGWLEGDGRAAFVAVVVVVVVPVVVSVSVVPVVATSG